MDHDVVIIGGGPAGLSAALALGRACKRVLLCDAGPRRNAAAAHIHNFVTRDGTPPDEFRSVARAQLAQYPNVEIRDVSVASVAGAKGAFDVQIGAASVRARRIVLAVGMIDEMLPIDGFADAWGHSIVQCPYCHGWEGREGRWVYLARGAHALMFVMQLRGWTRDVTLLTDGSFELDDAARSRLESASIRVDTRKVVKLRVEGRSARAVEFADGGSVPCDLLFAHPPQRHVQLVQSLGLALDDDGIVRVDPMTRETSVPGIYAAGDLATRMQGAILAASLGTQAAAMLNHELTAELAVSGLI